MDIGVYVDGYNLYYGGRGIIGGRGQPGWRWLDLRGLATRLAKQGSTWSAARIARVVYCMARIRGAGNSGASSDQDRYLRALKRSGSVDAVELGHYVSRVAIAPLATWGKRGQPEIWKSDWPVVVRDQAGEPVERAEFMVSYARREEKGSDVNVATHLMIDVLGRNVDAAIVISNDSDLALPVREARRRVPVGLVNPTKEYLAGKLRGEASEGAGTHWWYQLAAEDLTACQLPDPAGGVRRPDGW